MKFTVYFAYDGWRWRLRSRNNRKIADSGESYTRKHDCLRAIERVKSCKGAQVRNG